MDLLTRFNNNNLFESNKKIINTRMSFLDDINTNQHLSLASSSSSMAINCDLIVSTSCCSTSTAPSPNSSSSDCLSSDEGYVGSYTDLSLSNTSSLESSISDLHKLVTQTQFYKQQQSQEDIYREQFECDYKIEMILSQIYNGKTCEFNLNSIIDKSQQTLLRNDNKIDEYLLLPFFVNNLSNDTNDDLFNLWLNNNSTSESWLKSTQTLHPLQQTSSQLRLFKRIKREQNEEDLVDVNAYINEIELNLELYKNDHEMDSYLSFNDNKQACNILMYEQETTKWFNTVYYPSIIQQQQYQATTRLSQLFANFDYIPEFVPPSTSVQAPSVSQFQQQQQQQNDHINDECYLHQVNDDCYYGTSGDQDLNAYDETLIQQNVEHEQHIESSGEEFYMEDIYETQSNLTKDIFENVYNDCNYLDENGVFSLSKKLAIDIQNGEVSSTSSGSSVCSSLTSSQRSLLPRLLAKYGHKYEAFRKPCIYKLNGDECKRADCRFAHDFDKIICKYWLEGECLKGDFCEFMHDLPADLNIDELFTSSSAAAAAAAALEAAHDFNNKHKNNKKDAKNQVFNLNTNDFPELGQVVNVRVPPVNDDLNEYPSLSSSPSLLATAAVEQVQSSKTSVGKKKQKINILCSLSLPTMTNASRKKHIN